jgi:hypothetical protein
MEYSPAPHPGGSGWPIVIAGFADGGRSVVAVETDALYVWTPDTRSSTRIAVPPSQFPAPATPWERPYAVHPSEPVCVWGRADGTVEIWDFRKELMLGAWTAHSLQ